MLFGEMGENNKQSFTEKEVRVEILDNAAGSTAMGDEVAVDGFRFRT